MSDSAEETVKCLIDTSVLANIQDEHKDSEEIWELLISEITRGRLKTVRHVMDELERRFPKIYSRLHPHRETFLIPDDMLYSASVVAEVRTIQQHHPQLYRPMGGSNSADPFLIAVAKERAQPEAGRDAGADRALGARPVP